MDKDKPKLLSKDDHLRNEQAAQWWLRLREGEIPPDNLNEWVEWRSRDPRNAEAFERAQDFNGRIAATDPKTLASLVDEFSMPESRPASTVRRRFRTTWRLSAAAALVGIGLAGLWVWSPQTVTKTDAVATESYSTPIASNLDIPLPDGSEVALGAASSMHAIFAADSRHIQLNDGEAFFKVKHEEKRAFYVQAGKLTVRAVGTAFDVRKTGERVTVTVAEGTVRVAQEDANVVEVTAGQQVTYSPAAVGLRVAKVDPGNATAWREDRLEFINEPLDSVIANINRYSKRELRIADPAIGRLSFTGTVNLQSLDRWLSALQITFPVRVESNATGVTILPVGMTS